MSNSKRVRFGLIVSAIFAVSLFLISACCLVFNKLNKDDVLSAKTADSVSYTESTSFADVKTGGGDVSNASAQINALADATSGYATTANGYKKNAAGGLPILAEFAYDVCIVDAKDPTVVLAQSSINGNGWVEKGSVLTISDTSIKIGTTTVVSLTGGGSGYDTVSSGLSAITGENSGLTESGNGYIVTWQSKREVKFQISTEDRVLKLATQAKYYKFQTGNQGYIDTKLDVFSITRNNTSFISSALTGCTISCKRYGNSNLYTVSKSSDYIQITKFDPNNPTKVTYTMAGSIITIKVGSSSNYLLFTLGFDDNSKVYLGTSTPQRHGIETFRGNNAPTYQSGEFCPSDGNDATTGVILLLEDWIYNVTLNSTSSNTLKYNKYVAKINVNLTDVGNYKQETTIGETLEFKVRRNQTINFATSSSAAANTISATSNAYGYNVDCWSKSASSTSPSLSTENVTSNITAYVHYTPKTYSFNMWKAVEDTNPAQYQTHRTISFNVEGNMWYMNGDTKVTVNSLNDVKGAGDTTLENATLTYDSVKRYWAIIVNGTSVEGNSGIKYVSSNNNILQLEDRNDSNKKWNFHYVSTVNSLYNKTIYFIDKLNSGSIGTIDTINYSNEHTVVARIAKNYTTEVQLNANRDSLWYKEEGESLSKGAQLNQDSGYKYMGVYVKNTTYPSGQVMSNNKFTFNISAITGYGFMYSEYAVDDKLAGTSFLTRDQYSPNINCARAIANNGYVNDAYYCLYNYGYRISAWTIYFIDPQGTTWFVTWDKDATANGKQGDWKFSTASASTSVETLMAFNKPQVGGSGGVVNSSYNFATMMQLAQYIDDKFTGIPGMTNTIIMKPTWEVVKIHVNATSQLSTAQVNDVLVDNKNNVVGSQQYLTTQTYLTFNHAYITRWNVVNNNIGFNPKGVTLDSFITSDNNNIIAIDGVWNYVNIPARQYIISQTTNMEGVGGKKYDGSYTLTVAGRFLSDIYKGYLEGILNSSGTPEFDSGYNDTTTDGYYIHSSKTPYSANSYNYLGGVYNGTEGTNTFTEQSDNPFNYKSYADLSSNKYWMADYISDFYEGFREQYLQYTGNGLPIDQKLYNNPVFATLGGESYRLLKSNERDEWILLNVFKENGTGKYYVYVPVTDDEERESAPTLVLLPAFKLEYYKLLYWKQNKAYFQTQLYVTYGTQLDGAIGSDPYAEYTVHDCLNTRYLDRTLPLTFKAEYFREFFNFQAKTVGQNNSTYGCYGFAIIQFIDTIWGEGSFYQQHLKNPTQDSSIDKTATYFAIYPGGTSAGRCVIYQLSNSNITLLDHNSDAATVKSFLTSIIIPSRQITQVKVYAGCSIKITMYDQSNIPLCLLDRPENPSFGSPQWYINNIIQQLKVSPDGWIGYKANRIDGMFPASEMLAESTDPSNAEYPYTTNITAETISNNVDRFDQPLLFYLGYTKIQYGITLGINNNKAGTFTVKYNGKVYTDKLTLTLERLVVDDTKDFQITFNANAGYTFQDAAFTMQVFSNGALDSNISTLMTKTNAMATQTYTFRLTGTWLREHYYTKTDHLKIFSVVDANLGYLEVATETIKFDVKIKYYDEDENKFIGSNVNTEFIGVDAITVENGTIRLFNTSGVPYGMTVTTLSNGQEVFVYNYNGKKYTMVQSYAYKPNSNSEVQPIDRAYYRIPYLTSSLIGSTRYTPGATRFSERVNYTKDVIVTDTEIYYVFAVRELLEIKLRVGQLDNDPNDVERSFTVYNDIEVTESGTLMSRQNTAVITIPAGATTYTDGGNKYYYDKNGNQYVTFFTCKNQENKFKVTPSVSYRYEATKEYSFNEMPVNSRFKADVAGNLVVKFVPKPLDYAEEFYLLNDDGKNYTKLSKEELITQSILSTLDVEIVSTSGKTYKGAKIGVNNNTVAFSVDYQMYYKINGHTYEYTDHGYDKHEISSTDFNNSKLTIRYYFDLKSNSVVTINFKIAEDKGISEEVIGTYNFKIKRLTTNAALGTDSYEDVEEMSDDIVFGESYKVRMIEGRRLVVYFTLNNGYAFQGYKYNNGNLNDEDALTYEYGITLIESFAPSQGEVIQNNVFDFYLEKYDVVVELGPSKGNHNIAQSSNNVYTTYVNSFVDIVKTDRADEDFVGYFYYKNGQVSDANKIYIDGEVTIEDNLTITSFVVDPQLLSTLRLTAKVGANADKKEYRLKVYVEYHNKYSLNITTGVGSQYFTYATYNAATYDSENPESSAVTLIEDAGLKYFDSTMSIKVIITPVIQDKYLVTTTGYTLANSHALEYDIAMTKDVEILITATAKIYTITETYLKYNTISQLDTANPVQFNTSTDNQQYGVSLVKRFSLKSDTSVLQQIKITGNDVPNVTIIIGDTISVKSVAGVNVNIVDNVIYLSWKVTNGVNLVQYNYSYTIDITSTEVQIGYQAQENIAFNVYYYAVKQIGPIG